MEIKSIRKYGNNVALPEVVTQITKKTESYLDSSLTKFIDNISPVITNYYTRDELASVTSVGDNTSFGPYSGATKYKVIKDYIVYGYPEEKNTTTERNEKEDIKTSVDRMSLLHLPNTIIPVPGDRFTLSLENHQLFYVVIEVDQVTLHNKSFYRADYKLDDNLPETPWTIDHMRKNKLITKELVFIQENLGTNYSPFLEEDFVKKLQKFLQYRYELNEMYNEYFYHEYTNMMVVDKTKEKTSAYHYCSIVPDIQMEYFPLKIYDGNDMILYQEAPTNSKTKLAWRKHPVRKFFRKKNKDLLNGFTVYEYEYFKTVDDPYHKIDTYMNSMNRYIVYDYIDELRKEPYEIHLPGEINVILSKWYDNEYESIDELITDLEDFEIEDMTIEWMVGGIILLVVLDKLYDEFTATYKVERFY